MYWKLNNDLALRSWRNLPYAVQPLSGGEAVAVDEADFGLLK